MSSALWCGWVLEDFPSLAPQPSRSSHKAIQLPRNTISRSCKLFFAGDTGYHGIESDPSLPCCPAFVETDALNGPFDFVLLPIGLYSP